MRYFSFTLGLVLAGASVAWAADKPPKGKPPNKSPADAADKTAGKEPADKEAAADAEQSIAEQIAAIETDFDKKQQEMIKRFRATEDQAERQKILEEYNSLQADRTAKYLEIVEKDADDPAVFPALQTLVFDPRHSTKALDLIVKHHLDNDRVGGVCLQLGMRGDPRAEKLIRAVVEESKSRDSRGLALLALGKMLSARADQQGTSDAKRGKLREEAKEALTTVSEKYADLDASGRNAGEWAKSILFEVEHLAIGLPVPDLAGEDLEGAEFKLSDYRGKVVFLDFWAHW